MLELGVLLALLSGVCNGLFTAPLKLIPEWKWENVWLVFVVTSCLVAPAAAVITDWRSALELLRQAPGSAVGAALGFGFAWGFGAIVFGLSVQRLGVSVSNSMVLGLSGALGALLPLAFSGGLRMEPRQLVLYAGVALFMAGVGLCGAAGRLRDQQQAPLPGAPDASLSGYLFAILAGIMSAVFNLGYSLALPIVSTGERLGFSRFFATNCIWMLALGAGSIPSVVFCIRRLRHNGSVRLFACRPRLRYWGPAILAACLWAGSIFLYGAASPLLGELGPSVGWPVSLAVALLVANLTGVVIGEWRGVGVSAQRRMRSGVLVLLVAIGSFLVSANLGA